VKININKRKYNKTVSKDGVHYEVDTDTEYECYEVAIYGRYCDVGSKEELKRRMKEDLEAVIKALDEKETER
jgi:hypothetical protein